MGREKRKGALENGVEEGRKKSKKREKMAEEPTDEEVEEFFVILRRIREATEYFRGSQRKLTDSLKAVIGDQEPRSESPEMAPERVPEVAEVSGEAEGKGKNENGLQLDLNIAVVPESESTSVI